MLKSQFAFVDDHLFSKIGKNMMITNFYQNPLINNKHLFGQKMDSLKTILRHNYFILIECN